MKTIIRTTTWLAITLMTTTFFGCLDQPAGQARTTELTTARNAPADPETAPLTVRHTLPVGDYSSASQRVKVATDISLEALHLAEERR